MKYLPPINGNTGDPNRGWPNADPANGLEGAIPGGEAIEHPLRELHALIATSGFTPTSADLQQVTKAIRSQHLNYFQATGGPNAYAITMSPAPASLAELAGTPLKILFPWANTGASTLTINGSTVALTRVGGIALGGGDIPAWGLMEATFDGTQAQLAAVAPTVFVPPAVAGRFLSMQFLITSGTYTPGAGVNDVIAFAVGAGGGGGGGSTTYNGGGGGGGEIDIGRFDVTGWGAGVPVVIGSGGSGGAADTPNTRAGSGGTTTFANLISAGGGQGGGSGNGTSSNGSGGAGGSGGVGTAIHFPGSAGSPGSRFDGGGGGAGLFGAGGGRGGQDNVAPTSGAGDGGTYGGGGGGGDSGGGGTGGNGAILVFEFS
ncbi:hypothetical protein V5F77_02360 [Xanthobacter sp. DSM 24535]|uniref:glycine-rich domain-containing protein n=1 Tax=Roseixanthobacter psychrophilus TaxID=3119917 RepID=UPI00372BAB60